MYSNVAISTLQVGYIDYVTWIVYQTVPLTLSGNPMTQKVDTFDSACYGSQFRSMDSNEEILRALAHSRARRRQVAIYSNK